MGIKAPKVIVTCDFPGCDDSQDLVTENSDRVEWNLIHNYRWIKIDTGGLGKEYFCPYHSRWFTSRKKMEVPM